MEEVNIQPERDFNVDQLAHWSLRLVNFIIDMTILICIQIAITIALRDYFYLEFTFKFVSNVIFFIISFLYYVLFEFFTGKTIGKYVTRTTVLTDGGLKPSLSTIIIRTLCRFIPFEIFSCVATAAHGWHNSLSKTIVLPDREIRKFSIN